MDKKALARKARGPESIPQKQAWPVCTGRGRWAEPGSSLVSPAGMVRSTFSERLRYRVIKMCAYMCRCARIQTQGKEDLLS